MQASASNQLNKKDHKIYYWLNVFIFSIFFILAFFLLLKFLFPSQFFTYSFSNVNSLKNTITEVVSEKDKVSFYASTPLNFSQAKITIELSENKKNIHDARLSIQKGYKSFFYPEGNPLENMKDKEENRLFSVENSVFIVGNERKIPIDSPLTFEGLGYQWQNLHKESADLSFYEKDKLADLNSAHPTGTIIKTKENSNYYFIENFTKRKIINPDLKKIENPILVEEASANQKSTCTLKNKILSKKKFYCELDLEGLQSLSGKDYRFTLENISDNPEFKRIELEFKKSPNRENFNFFIGELKKKILYRFGFKEE